MIIAVDSRIDVDRAAPEVFAKLTDVGSWPRWGSIVESFAQITPPPLQVGSRLLQRNRSGERPVETPFEVTAFVSNELFALASPALRCSFELAPRTMGTRVSARFRVEATGWIAILYRLLLQRWVEGDLRRFKAFVEATDRPHLA